MTQLPLPLPGVEVVPTVAMVEGRSRLVQCGDCGVAMAVPDGYLSDHRHDDPLGGCPRCGCETWWSDGGNDRLGPFVKAAS